MKIAREFVMVLVFLLSLYLSTKWLSGNGPSYDGESSSSSPHILTHVISLSPPFLFKKGDN